MMMIRASILSVPALLSSLYLVGCGGGSSHNSMGPDDSAEPSFTSGGAAPSAGLDQADGGQGLSTAISPASALAPTPTPTPALGKVAFQSNLDTEDQGCWDNRNSSGYARTSCGPWGSIGATARLVPGLGRNGSKAMRVTFSKNEEVGGASLSANADVINVRAYYNFAEGFDFGQGVKVARISSFNNATQVNDIDMVLTVRSSGSANQCGLTDMADLGIFYNGRPKGHDWGSIGAPIRFQRGRWYAVEYQVKLNTPGRSDGWVKIWVDGAPAASKEGLNIRGSGGSNVKINRIRVGGWYSNSANGNSGCANPSQPSVMHIDDVAVGSNYIGV